MTINQRLIFLIKELGLNTKSFSDRMGVNDGTTRTYTSRGSKPSSEYLEKIVRAYDTVNAKWLLTGEGEPFTTHTIDTNKSMQVVRDEPKGNMPKVVVVDPQNRNRTVLIGASHSARAGYLSGYGDPEYMEDLPSYDLPGLYKGTYRMFEVDGHSMAPTLHNKDIVVAEWVEDLEDMRDERIYVLVTREGVVIKRCLNRVKQYGYIIAKSDNISKIDTRPEYENLHIYPEDIYEIWYSRLYISHNFHHPSDTYNRLSNTEAELGHLIQQLKKKGIL